MLLNGHIGQVDKHVVQLPGTVVVLDGAEPTEALTAPIAHTYTHVHVQTHNNGMKGAKCICHMFVT